MHPRTIMLAVLASALAACGGDSTGPDALTPVATLSIADLPDTLLTRQTLRLAASAADENGTSLPDRPLTWRSSNPAVASVTAGGTLTAVAPGATTISVTTDSVEASVRVTVRALRFAHVAVGATVACGLEASGESWCWGNVGHEGYGNGSADTSRQAVPLRAARGFTFSGLALANGGACGIEVTGAVACWGRNDSAQVGDGTTTPHLTPVEVAGVSGVVQLVAGAYHFCARSGSGAVSCWGSNEWKQSGGTARTLVTQARAIALAGPASDLSAGDKHSCALVSGVSYCWGADYSRQLGNDTSYDRLVPVRAATGDGVAHIWTDLQALANNTCARDQAGAMFCWGILEAQGDNDTTEWLPTRHFPNSTMASMGDGWFERCAVDQQGAAWCESRASDTPRQLATSGLQSVVVSGAPCLLGTAGAVTCVVPGLPDSVVAIALPTPAVRLVATSSTACSIDASMAVYCWSTWSLTQNNVPVQWFAGHAVASIFADGGDRICIIASDDTASCRDDFQSGTESLEPTGGQAFDSLAIGDNHTCGLTSAGATWCWGKNDHGQLGDGTTTDRAAPVLVQGGHVFVQLAAGWNHTCGRTAAGEIWCWGYGSYGQMADDHRDESAFPVSVDGLAPASNITSGCALSGGTAWCWPGALGVPAPRQIPGADGLVSLTGPCGLGSTGDMLCWGSNYSGWFGNGSYQTRYENAVPGGSAIRFSEVSFGRYGAACGIALDGATYCWGDSYYLAIPSPEATGGDATVPVVVVGS